MNVPRRSHRRIAGHYAPPGLRLPRVLDLRNLSLSTKLTLLLLLPMALMLVVALPLTVTGLNRLASVTGAERLQEEIRIIEEQFQHFEDQLNGAADDIARNPILLTAVRESDRPIIVSNLLSASIRLDLQHLEIFDENGTKLGYGYRFDRGLDSRAIGDLNALGLAELETTRIVSTQEGWLLTAVRALKDSRGYIGSVSVGRLIDVDALSELNFGRSDPLLLIVGDDGEVVSASHLSSEAAMPSPITLDLELVKAARSGQIAVGSATIDGTEQRAAYAPLVLESGSRGVLAVVLTTSPVAGLRDQLVADHIMVTAALVLLVLGVGYVVTSAITRRILVLRDGAVEIANGNLSIRIEENAHDEMGTLAHEFNRMADSLNDKNSQLEQANRNLEMRVFERTEELEKTNVQLLEAQSQLVRTEKLAAIGELSAGVAHDLRNPLGAIRNGVYFLKSKLVKSGRLTTEPKVAEYLNIMDERITQCDKIIGDLISYTRISAPNYSAVTLGDALETALLGIETPDGISVTKDYSDDPVEIQADMNQLVRVFANLMINAHEAMPEGGELTIGLRAVGPTAEVTFTDTGAGISPGELEKVLDPLYTTKIQGVGLGLAVCQQIIAKHHGSLKVSSKVGIGATFTVTIPMKTGESLTATAQR